MLNDLLVHLILIPALDEFLVFKEFYRVEELFEIDHHQKFSCFA